MQRGEEIGGLVVDVDYRGRGGWVGLSGVAECSEEEGDVGFERRVRSFSAPVSWVVKALLDVDKEEGGLGEGGGHHWDPG